HALGRELGDMHQAVGAGQYLDEGAELDDLAHGAFVDAADLGFGGDALDHLDGFLGALFVAGGDHHRAVVLDVDLDAGRFDDAADDFAARADDLADLVRFDVQRDDARRVAGNVAARRRQGGVHDAQDVEPAFFGLVQRLAHDLAIDAADLDVHLQRSDAVGSAGDLEIHVAQMVLVAEDVREHAHVLAFFDQAHRDTGHRRRHRHAGVHQRQRAAADRGHGGGAVGFENLGDDADGIGKAVLGRQHRHQRALGEIAVADLAPARAAQKFHFADAERRKIVMQHEFFEVLADQGIDPLLVGSGAQGRHHQRLGFAAGKQRRAVGARQHLGFAGDRADVLQAAAVDAPLFLNHQTAKDVALELFEGVLDIFLLVGELGQRERHDFGFDFGDAFVAFELFGDFQRLFQFLQGESFDPPGHRAVQLRQRHVAFGLAQLAAQLFLNLQQRLNRFVAGEQSFENFVLGHALRAALDHHDRIAAAGKKNIDVALAQLGLSRIHHPAAVHPADAHAGDRSV